MIEYFDFLPKYYRYYLTGTANTIKLSLLAILLGFSLGLILSLMKLAGKKNVFGFLLSLIASIYIEVIRGTPLIIQLYIVYYSFEDMPMFLAGIIAMTINSAAYVAEIIRAGILSIDRGQTEAARSLGMSSFLTYKEIIIPQALKNILPALGNEFIVLIKESAIVSVIGITELMRSANLVQSKIFKGIPPLIVASVIYLSMTFVLSRVMVKVEKKLTAGR